VDALELGGETGKRVGRVFEDEEVVTLFGTPDLTGNDADDAVGIGASNQVRHHFR
jgi:hypothetical protein